MGHSRRCSAVLTALALLLYTALSGCGFHLKGSDGASNTSLDGVSIALIASRPRGELANAVSRSLRLSGAVLVEPGAAELVVRLDEEQFARRNLSLTAQARAAEVELTLATQFSLSRGREQQRVELVPDTPASITRQMLDDPGNVVGKNEELGLLRSEMRRDIADQIVRRITYSLGN